MRIYKAMCVCVGMYCNQFLGDLTVEKINNFDFSSFPFYFFLGICTLQCVFGFLPQFPFFLLCVNYIANYGNILYLSPKPKQITFYFWNILMENLQQFTLNFEQENIIQSFVLILRPCIIFFVHYYLNLNLDNEYISYVIKDILSWVVACVKFN